MALANGTSLPPALRLLFAPLALLLVVLLTWSALRTGDQKTAIRLKRATDYIDERKQEFLEALDEP